MMSWESVMKCEFKDVIDSCAQSVSTNDDKYAYSIQITESLITNSSTITNCTHEPQIEHSFNEYSTDSLESIRGNGDTARNARNGPLDYKQPIDDETVVGSGGCSDGCSDGSQRSYKPSFNSRQMHNQKERMRRSRMKSSCEALRRMVPGVNDKTDKATVLEQTVNFLLHLSSCSGVNCTDYIPEIHAVLSSKSMQYYQQYVPSNPYIDYHSSQQLDHQIENEVNDENDGKRMNGYHMNIIDCSDCGDCGDRCDPIIAQSTARLVTTNDGQQFMVIDANDDNDDNDDHTLCDRNPHIT